MSELDAISGQIRAAEIDSYCAALPATIVAQGLGGCYLVWALLPVVSEARLLLGACGLVAVLGVGALLHRYHDTNRAVATNLRVQGRLVIAYSFANGCFWGSVGIALYPAPGSAYAPLVFVLLSILPFVPVAAMAGYLPAFYAYLLPVALPFVLRLALPPGRPGISAAVLFTMLLVAASRFAYQYNHKLTEAMRLQFTVEQQKAFLEQANRDKAKFLASASHDLRQPLHALSLNIDALENHATTEQLRDLHQRLTNSSDAMYGLLDAILDISKLDAGVVEVDRSSFEVGGLLQRLGAEYQPPAAAKGLSVSVAPTSLIVTSDPVLLEQLLRNFLTNAIRYTSTGGIVIGARRRQHECLIQVADSGIGIAAADIDRIFSEFIQLNNPERDRRQGLGLGLANAKRLSQLLEHRLVVNSKLGSGSIFSICVPTAAAVTGQVRAAWKPALESSVKGAVLLVIDDEVDILRAMHELAKAWSCRVVTATSGEEAIRKLEAENLKPDAMIADYRLRNGATGITAIAIVRERVGADLPAMIVTGDTGVAALTDVRRSGHQLMHKPLRPGQLKAMLSQAMAGAKASSKRA